VPPLVHHELALDDGIQVAVEHHDSRAVADLGACRDGEVQRPDVLARVVDQDVKLDGVEAREGKRLGVGQHVVLEAALHGIDSDDGGIDLLFIDIVCDLSRCVCNHDVDCPLVNQRVPAARQQLGR